MFFHIYHNEGTIDKERMLGMLDSYVTMVYENATIIEYYYEICLFGVLFYAHIEKFHDMKFKARNLFTVTGLSKMTMIVLILIISIMLAIRIIELASFVGYINMVCGSVLFAILVLYRDTMIPLLFFILPICAIAFTCYGILSLQVH